MSILKSFKYVVASIVLFPICTFATEDVVSGVFSGGGKRILSGCTLPASDGITATKATIIVKRLDNKFRATGQIQFGGVTRGVRMQGNIGVNGNIVFDLDLQTPIGISSFSPVSGSVINGIMRFSVSNINPLCSSADINLTLKLNELISEFATGNQLTTALQIRKSARALGNIQRSRIKTMFKKNRSIGPGVKPISDGMMFEGQSGISAGSDFDVPVGVWASYTTTNSEDSFSSTAFDNHSNVWFAGTDIRPNDNLVMGLALGFEKHDVTTDFNTGKQDISGYTLSPYIGGQLTDNLSVSLSGGYTWLDIDQYRTDTTNNIRIKSDLKSQRFFIAGGFDFNTAFKNWLINAHTGISWTNEQQDGFTESDGTAQLEQNVGLSQWQLGGEVAYSMNEFEPYLSALYSRDYNSTQLALSAGEAQPSSDNDDVLVTMGLRYFSDNGLSASAEWSRVFARDNYYESTLNFLIRADF